MVATRSELLCGSERIALELPATSEVGDWSARPGGCLVVPDVAAAVRAALREPLNFPPLESWTTPGDQIVLAVQEGLVAGEAIVSATILELLYAGVEPDHITVLASSAQRESLAPRLSPQLPADVRDAVRIAVHNPADSQQLAFLGASAESQPVYLNKLLCDADFVIPLGAVGRPGAPQNRGIAGQIFPGFSDVPTLKRFHEADVRQSAKQLAHRQREADQAFWLLGPVFALQVVPAGNGEVCKVFAGAIEAVTDAGRQAYDDAWRQSVEQRSELVVAGLSLPASEQTWHNLTLGLSQALHVVEEGGAVVLCSGWEQPPGATLRKIANADSRETALQLAQRSKAPDALFAQLLLSALGRVRVLMMSRWSEQFIEQLGMGAVTDPSQIARLARSYSRCLLLGNAQLLQLDVLADHPSVETT